jgi:hypothetical protein
MELSIEVLSILIKPLLSLAKDKWNKRSEFQTLRHLAYERLSRELHWNAECLYKHKSDNNQLYFELLRTDAFDLLVSQNIPLDYLMSEPINHSELDNLSDSKDQFRKRIDGCAQVSDLIDRVYNRLWMLKHRQEGGISPGDTKYLLNLTLFTLAHLINGRRELSSNAQQSAFKWVPQLFE